MRGDLLAVGRDQPGQPVGAVHQDGPLPGQVVEADVVQLDLGRIGAEQPGEQPLEPDGHVAQADRAVPGVQQGAGHDADRVGEVDDPGPGVGPLPGPLGDVQHDRHGPQRLGQAARAGGLLADAAALQRPGLVPLPGGLAADPELEQYGAGPVDARIQVRRPADPRRVAVGAHDPGRYRPDRREPALVGIDQGQLGDLERTGEPGHPVDQFRRVGRSAAHDRDLHQKAFTSAPAWATKHAAACCGPSSAGLGQSGGWPGGTGRWPAGSASGTGIRAPGR